jgi:hypothetical protein
MRFYDSGVARCLVVDGLQLPRFVLVTALAMEAHQQRHNAEENAEMELPQDGQTIAFNTIPPRAWLSFGKASSPSVADLLRSAEAYRHRGEPQEQMMLEGRAGCLNAGCLK